MRTNKLFPRMWPACCIGVAILMAGCGTQVPGEEGGEGDSSETAVENPVELGPVMSREIEGMVQLVRTADPALSSIVFTVDGGAPAVAGSGSFGLFDCVVHFSDVGGQAVPARLLMTVEMESLATGSGVRTDLLLSDEYLAVEEFPTASFTSSDIRRNDDGTWSVSGTMRLRGVSADTVFSLQLHEDSLRLSGTVDPVRFGIGGDDGDATPHPVVRVDAALTLNGVGR